MDAVEQALRGGAIMTGATVHLVTEELDSGPILAQEAVPVLSGDTVENLRQRIHEAEHRILPMAIRLLEARLAQSPAVGQ
jgi:phosphoribosylglycinamide formyltransferase-1